VTEAAAEVRRTKNTSEREKTNCDAIGDEGRVRGAREVDGAPSARARAVRDARMYVVHSVARQSHWSVAGPA
jgi:hypothetical protein